MRQFFTIRLIAAVVGLALLALLVDPIASVISGLPDDEAADGEVEQPAAEPVARVIDVVAPVQFVRRSDDFAIDDGITVGFLDIELEDRRSVRIAPGTFGSIDCRGIGDDCALFADVLGDAVIWFALVRREGPDTVLVPPVLALQDGYAVLENGWRIKYAPTIERVCADEDIVSFTDFLRRFSEGSSTVVDLETQIVTEVRCAQEGPSPASTTTVVTTTTLPDAELIDAPDTVPEN